MSGFRIRFSALPLTLAIWLGIAAVPHATAQETVEFLRLIEQAEDQLSEDSLPSLEEAESEVSEAIEATADYFAQGTSKANYDLWMEYLQLEELQEAIEDEESIGTRGRAALALSRRLVGPETGLELSKLVHLREVVRGYVAALRYGDPKRGTALVKKQLDALAEIIAPEKEVEKPKESKAKSKTSSRSKSTTKSKSEEEEAKEKPSRILRSLHSLTPEETAQIESILVSFSEANQANELVERFRSRYSSPNIVGWVDGRVITQSITRPVDNPNDVNDCIMGTRVVGQARVVGAVTGSLLPSVGYVRMLLRLDGDFSTTSRGYNGPVSLDTSGFGRVYAARQLAITEKGVVLGSVLSTASLSTNIDRINHRWRLVRRIASKKAAEAKPQAEAISRAKLQQRVEEGFTTETAQAANQDFPDVDARMQPWLRRFDLPAPTRTLGSTTDAVFVRAKMQRDTGLAAPSSPPALQTLQSANGSGVYPGGYQAAIQVHESVLNNTVMGLLSGDTFTPERLASLTESLGVELPTQPSQPKPAKPAKPSKKSKSDDDALALEDDSDEDSDELEEEDSKSFEVDFAGFRPVFFEARNQSLRIGIRGTRFSQGDRELKRTLEVAAVYRPVSSYDGTMMLQRDEDIDLSFPGGRRLSISQTAIKANIEDSFNDLFPRTLLHRPIEVPSTVKFPAVAGKSYRVSAIDLQEGWVSIAVR